LLKVLFYALLAYLLLRAVANLLRAMLQQQGVGAGRDGRTGRAPPEDEDRATRLREQTDIEDATWEDL
jgi:hypothetical protein